MAEEGRVDKEAIIRALQEAMTMGESGKTISDVDRMRMQRREGMSDAGRTISDADRARIKGMMGSIPSVGKGLGGEMDLSPDEEKALEMILRMRKMKNKDAESKAFPPASMMKSGGAVTKKTKKPKMGVVMKGRGGSYKGMK